MNRLWLSRFRRYLQRRNFSRYTVRNYLHALAMFLRAVGKKRPEAVTEQDVARYIELLQAQRLVAKTINGRLSAIRQFYEFIKRDYNSESINPVRSWDFLKEPRPLPGAANEEDLIRFFSQIRSLRDRALCFVLLRSGLRVSEAVGLEVRDVDLRRQALKVRLGKNQRERQVYLSNDTVSVLWKYLAQRGWPEQGRLFVSEKGTTLHQSLSVRGVQKRMETYARRAGVQINCHMLRHTMATQLLNQGVRLVVIQELLGHSKVETTQRYARLVNRRVREEYFAGMNKIVDNTK